MMTPITDPAAIRSFVLAGRAHVTLRSTKTGARFTYRFRATKAKDAWFVSLLTGPDNETSYRYLALLTKQLQLRPDTKRYVSEQSPSYTAMRFFCSKVLVDGRLPDGLEVWHEGRCGRCNRLLTDPTSIARGIGPECVLHI